MKNTKSNKIESIETEIELFDQVYQVVNEDQIPFKIKIELKIQFLMVNLIHPNLLPQNNTDYEFSAVFFEKGCSNVCWILFGNFGSER